MRYEAMRRWWRSLPGLLQDIAIYTLVAIALGSIMRVHAEVTKNGTHCLSTQVQACVHLDAATSADAP